MLFGYAMHLRWFESLQCGGGFIQKRHAVTALFWPSGREKTPDFRGFFGVTSFLESKPGWAGGIRTHGMTESKSVALPLGDSPVWRTRSLIAKIKLRVHKSGVEDGTRTHGLQSHNLAL